MRQAQVALSASAVMLALVTAPVMAQDWSQDWADPEDRPARVDFSASAGGVMPTRWSDLVVLGSISSAFGVLEQVLTRDLRVEPNSDFSAAVTYWRGRYGFRTQGGFSRSSLRIGGIPLGASPLSTLPPGVTSVGVNTYFYDVRGAIGFLDYRPTRWIWPYGFFGLGGITYKLKTAISPPLTFVGSEPIRTDASGNTIIVSGNGRQFVLGVDELSTETVFAVNFGIGTDFRIPVGAAGVGLRVEVADQVSPSPVRVRIHDLSALPEFVPDSSVAFPLVHQLSATAGIVVRVGR